MQANSADHQSIHASAFLGVSSSFVDGMIQTTDESLLQELEPVHFRGYYASTMEMYADTQTVENYLNVHREWFCRCSSPMKADPLGDNGYALTIGRFGALGYEVEPKIGLHLLPQDGQGVYRIETIPVPGYVAPGYEVDFKAALQLVETDPSQANLPDEAAPAQLTRVEWDLHLDVAIQFPRFIRALPQHLIQSTGDRVLNQVVRQVSRCLTLKVQEDFHSTHNIPFPKKRKRNWALRIGG
ncbi:MAG TPA: DUF1997 domain-containing protein [Synechococcales cyanobacterium M55_K2018_004]|nr:DUF1997 domain-containing protein [Synechococcales cyanobacterium M55_K2018_004]